MKDIDETIQHCEDVAQQQDMLKGRYDDASGYTRSGNEAIRTSDAKKCEKCAADHRQLAEWLKDYKRLLELQSCEDAISRQAVNTLIDELARAISDERCCISRGRSTATIMRDILHLPPVTPQQKVGRWIESKGCDDIDHFYVCSECGRYIKLNCGEKLSDYPYCHCGRKMQESEE